MSTSKSKTSSTQNTTQNQTATTTPNVPDWWSSLNQTLSGQVGSLIGSGQDLVAGASPLQQQAFTGAAGLTTSPYYGQAAGLAGQAAGAGANTAAWTGYNPTGQAQTQSYAASSAPGVEGYTPVQSGAASWQAQNAGAASWQAQNAGAASWQAQNAGAANTGQSSSYDPSLVDPSGLSVNRTTLGPLQQASSGSFTDVDLSRYMNAGLDDMLAAQAADFDADASSSRARQAAASAFTGGARNSNNMILAAEMEGQLARARDSGLSASRYNAYNTAAGLAQADLDRAAQTSQFNAGQANQGVFQQGSLDASTAALNAQLQQAGILSNQQAQNAANQFGADATNQFAIQNAGFEQQANLANQQAQNSAASQNAGFEQQTNLANQTAANSAASQNAGFEQQANLANQTAANSAASQNAGFEQQTNLANQTAANSAASQNAGFEQQANLANQQAQNEALYQLLGLQTQAGLDAAGRQDAASQFGANAANQAALDWTGRQDAAGQFNAGAFNNNSQFNAGQRDTELQRILQSAGLLGNLGQMESADQRAIVDLQSLLGGQQRDIANQTSEATRIAMLQQLLAGLNPDLFTGQTVNGTSSGTQTGKSTTSQFGASLNDFMKIAALF